MNQIERVHQQPSNLMTGIAAVGAPTQTAASGRSWRTIPLKTRCLDGSPVKTNGSREPLCAATGVQFVSVRSDHRERISRRRRDKKSSVSKFRFLVDNSFEGRKTVLDDWDQRVRK